MKFDSNANGFYLIENGFWGKGRSNEFFINIQTFTKLQKRKGFQLNMDSFWIHTEPDYESHLNIEQITQSIVGINGMETFLLRNAYNW